jgi:hypothetical protein
VKVAKLSLVPGGSRPLTAVSICQPSVSGRRDLQPLTTRCAFVFHRFHCCPAHSQGSEFVRGDRTCTVADTPPGQLVVELSPGVSLD